MIRDLVLASGGSSPVGVDWTYQADMAVEWAKNTASHVPASIAWSGTQFCATGSEGGCATSPDGVNWTQQPGLRSSGFGGNVHPVIRWCGDKFYVAGSGGAGLLATSTDGVTWTTRSGITDGSYDLLTFDMAWSGSKLCVVGRDLELGTGVIATSQNGINWERRRVGTASLFSSNVVTSVAWAGSYFCAVYSSSGGYTTAADPALAYISYDGTSWQPYTLPDCLPLYISWSGTQFCLTSQSRTSPRVSQVHTSPDGHTWTAQSQYTTVGSPLGNVRPKVQWVDNQFITFDDVSGVIMTSQDGVTWTHRPVAPLSAWGSHNSPMDMAWNGSKLCVVGAAYQNYPEGIFGAAVTSP